MADSFRIGSGDGKTPEISKKPIDSTILEKIDLMEPATAFVAVQGIVVPTLNQLKKDLSYLSASLKPSDLPSPMQLADTRESIFLKLKSLDAQAAFMYLTTVVIPFLQNESAEILEKQGKTMKLVSEVFDKWNDIQDEINKTTKTLKILQEGKSIGDIDVVITLIEDYHRKSDNTDWKVVTIKDPKGYINIKINEKVREFKQLLDKVKKKLPKTSKELVETLDTLADGLNVEEKYEKGYYNFNWNNEGVFKFEVQNKDVPDFKDNKDFEKMKKIIWDRITGSSRFLIDPDQTKAKIYLDNIGQGVTALTSISNMTQQELQLASQYHNTLLGLQKTAYDAISKVVQVATKSPPA